MAFRIRRNDITKVKADVIVNTVNPLATIVDGVDSAIDKCDWHTKINEGFWKRKNLEIMRIK